MANQLALSGLALLLLSLVCAVFLILDVVHGMMPAIILAAGMFAWFAADRSRLLPSADGRQPDRDR